MSRFAVVFGVLAALSGCATVPSWEHPSRAKAGSDEATIALAECQSYAAGLTPMPRLQAGTPMPGPTSYSTTGTITDYGSYLTFRGTTTASSTFASRYAAGANAGANIANAYAVAAARGREDALTAACMRTQGWVDTSTPEGKEKLTQVAKASEIAASRRDDASRTASEQWAETIRKFMDAQTKLPGGIDYRNDDIKLSALDTYVKMLGNDPRNNDKTMLWFLVEADRLIKDTSGLQKAK
jgi:uncharacterized protein YceK